MTQKIRVCLFGAGEMATIHAMNLISDPRVTLAYVVDPSAERADSLAQATGARVVDLDTSIGDPTVDAYLIASPPRTHADYLERAAATRAYVFCEKPIDHDMGRILTCMKAWKGREGRVQLGFNRRFDHQFVALKQAIAEGRIGKVEQVLVISRDAEAPEVEGFIHSSGLLKETAVHDFDLIRWITQSEIAKVYATQEVREHQQYAKYNDADVSLVSLTTVSGVQVAITGTRHDPVGHDVRLEIFGSKDSLAVGLNKKTPIHDIEGEINFAPVRYKGFIERFREAFAKESQAFHKLTKGEISNPCPPKSAREALRVAIACEESIKTSQPVSL